MCPWTVHPHACGVYLDDDVVVVGDHGSSPRMWGIPSCRTYGLADTRFIPTHVGYTTGSLENVDSSTGSSPRMWGIPNAPYPA